MQSWFKYSIAFFGLVLLLTGFIYILGPSSTRQAAMSGETQTGQLMNPNHTLVSRGEPQPASASTTEPSTETESGTTTAAKEKSGDAKAAAATDAKAAAPAKDGAAKVPTPTASPAHDAHKGH